MNKMITVIFITIVFIGIAILYATGFITAIGVGQGPLVILFLAGIIFIGIIMALIYNMYKRIKEIKEEDEDDFSKY